jgi:AhpD family alkylhydroperoxidase
MNKSIDKLYNDLNDLKAKLPNQIEASMNLTEALEHICILDIKTQDLINIAFAISNHSKWALVRHIKEAFQHGVTREEIIAAACFALIKFEDSAMLYIEPLKEAIDNFDPVKNFRSDCYWLETD